jgi:hypothetical protein
MGLAAKVFLAAILIDLQGQVAILVVAASPQDETAQTIRVLTGALGGVLAAGCMALALAGRLVYARLPAECGGGTRSETAAYFTGGQILVLTGAILLGSLELGSPIHAAFLLFLWLLLYVLTEILFLLSLGRAVKRLHPAGISSDAALYWVALVLGLGAIVVLWILNPADPRRPHDFTPVYNGIVSGVVMLAVWLTYLNVLSVARSIVREELKRVKSLPGSQVSE